MSRRDWGMATLVLVAGLSFACGADAKSDTMPPRRLSATEHHNEALRHDREASERERVAQAGTGESAGGGTASHGCFDQPVPIPDPELGGEDVPVLRPCWSAEIRPTSDSERESSQHRRQAARHREEAAALWRAERQACAGLGQDEISHSPFFHRADIERVEPVRSGSRVLGARVLFRQVRGLDAAWMRKAIACHQARAAALGFPPRVMSYCPLMVAPTHATVEPRGDRISVTVTAERDEDAAAVLGRAQALLGK
jgi:hypothetical protein